MEQWASSRLPAFEQKLHSWGGHACPVADCPDQDMLSWQAMVRGEVEALDDLYDRHGGLALGLAARILGDQQAAEDAAQEGFL